MTLTSYGSTLVTPPPQARRGIALCLSGGGFRAALFHLGAVRRLYELGLLQQVDTITAVSGGTLAAAHLAQHCPGWRTPKPRTDWWEATIAAPFRAFVSRNLSAWPVLKGLFHPYSNVGVEALARRIESRLTPLRLDQLPEKPRFIFCASDLVSGLNYFFERGRKGGRPSGVTTVAHASAVSACHPVFLRPYTEKWPQRIALVDGGVFDDRGIEPVWKDHRTLLVSDSGDVLRPQRADSLFWPLARSVAVIWDRYQLVQQRWLVDRFRDDPSDQGGAFWSIGGAVEHFRDPGNPALPGYSAALARDTIAPIRTDYDAFSAAEAAVLENHGYLLANAAAQVHLTAMQPLATPLQIPHPAWMPDRLVRDALRDSSRKKLFGRGFLDLRGDAPAPSEVRAVPDCGAAIEPTTS